MLHIYGLIIRPDTLGFFCLITHRFGPYVNGLASEANDRL